MSSRLDPGARGPLARAVNAAEETAMAVILGLMALVTFANVVMRYGFNSSLIWGLETTLILFAWLVLFGVSYCVKVTAHLGVDALINLPGPRGRKALALVAGLVCIAYALLLLKGAWDYWAPFAALQPTGGRWLPTGFEEGVRSRAFYETEQVPMPGFLRFVEGWTLNRGFPPEEWQSYEKLPRVIPYVMLPVGCALLLVRIVQAVVEVAAGRRDGLIVSHEAEQALDEAAARRDAGEEGA